MTQGSHTDTSQTRDCGRLHKTAQGYIRLCKAAQDCTRLHQAAHGYKRLQKAAKTAQRYTRLQKATED